MRTEELVALLVLLISEGDINSKEHYLEVRRELKARPIRQISEAYSNSNDLLSYELYGLLLEIGDSRVERVFRRSAKGKNTVPTYLSLKRLGEQGEKWALRILNKNYQDYPVSSLEWAEIVMIFGKHRYREAAENLVESLDAASLNLASAAHEALCEIFPDAARATASFQGGPQEAQRFWMDYIKTH